MLSACGGGGGTSSGGDIGDDIDVVLIDVSGNWSGTIQSNSANISGTVILSLNQTDDGGVSGTASITFPPPYVSCLESATVSGTVFSNIVTLTISASNGTSVLASGDGTSTEMTGVYNTTQVNVSLGCNSDTGTFEVTKN